MDGQYECISNFMYKGKIFVVGESVECPKDINEWDCRELQAMHPARIRPSVHSQEVQSKSQIDSDSIEEIERPPDMHKPKGRKR
ncbi:MAG: hypothetical protein NPIRA02_29640 [Nitrospirales bacterium]|nr:MAG: hypothetical protein NPIRA02_29640 [Nitrospirales bacterium]